MAEEDRKQLLGLPSLEIYNSVFKLTKEKNKIKLNLLEEERPVKKGKIVFF